MARDRIWTMVVCFATFLLLVEIPGTHAYPSASSLNQTVTSNLPGNQVVCQQTNWYDVLWFYFANYILHAMSVRSMPGETLLASLAFKIACLIIPYTGLRRGLCLIARAANFTTDDLQSAARSNALCMIVRTAEWTPEDGQEVAGCHIERRAEHNSSTARSSKEQDGEKAGVKESTRAVGVDLAEPSTPAPEIKECPTASTDSSLPSEHGQSEPQEDQSPCLRFKMVDPYQPRPPFNFLDKLYRIFVETFKFSQHVPTKLGRLNPEHFKVHGYCNLAPGYGLAWIPDDIRIFSRYKLEQRPSRIAALRLAWRTRNLQHAIDRMTSETRLSSTQNVSRILFSLAQTVSGAYTLWRAQGAEIDKYGYAAYGLTVIPYVIVSIVNFIGSVLTSEYDMIYMIHSATMDEMVARGGKIDAVVGTLENNSDDQDGITASSEWSTAQRGELIISEGSRMRFNGNTNNMSCENLTESNSSSPSPDDLSTSYSEALPVRPLPVETKPKKKWDCKCCGRGKRKEERRRQAANRPDPLFNSTVITVPAYGPFTRLPALFYEPFLHVFCLALLIAAFATPYITIWLLSGWRTAQSTSSQRSFMQNWLIFGTTFGYFAGMVERLSGREQIVRGLTVVFVSYGCYCISGFVVVAQQMIDFGTCTAV